MFSATGPEKLCVGKQLVREATNHRESHFRAFATNVHVAHLVEALTASSRVKSLLRRFKNRPQKVTDAFAGNFGFRKNVCA
jgi:hypothetical protein